MTQKQAQRLLEECEAVVFDFDGLLVDSEDLGFEVSRRVLRQHFGIELPATERDSFFGVFDGDYYRRLRDEHALPWSVDELLEEHYRIYDCQLLTAPTVLPGAGEVVRRVAAGDAPVALCSGSFRYQVDGVLARLGWSDLFPVRVCAEDTRRHKPDPAPYVETARRLGVEPASCLVLEDSSAGVTAALQAGMRCIGVEIGSRGGQDLTLADAVVPSLEAFGLVPIPDRFPQYQEPQGKRISAPELSSQ